jgi:hypothetical protein
VVDVDIGDLNAAQVDLKTIDRVYVGEHGRGDVGEYTRVHVLLCLLDNNI